MMVMAIGPLDAAGDSDGAALSLAVADASADADGAAADDAALGATVGVEDAEQAANRAAAATTVKPRRRWERVRVMRPPA